MDYFKAYQGLSFKSINYYYKILFYINIIFI